MIHRHTYIHTYVHKFITSNTVRHILNQRHRQSLGGGGLETRELKRNDFRQHLNVLMGGASLTDSGIY